MSNVTLNKVNIKVRGDTAANWSSANPILLKNEPGYDETNKKFKIGDGTTPWNSLSYIEGSSSSSESAFKRITDSFAIRAEEKSYYICIEGELAVGDSISLTSNDSELPVTLTKISDTQYQVRLHEVDYPLLNVEGNIYSFRIIAGSVFHGSSIKVNNNTDIAYFVRKQGEDKDRALEEFTIYADTVYYLKLHKELAAGESIKLANIVSGLVTGGIYIWQPPGEGSDLMISVGEYNAGMSTAHPVDGETDVYSVTFMSMIAGMLLQPTTENDTSDAYFINYGESDYPTTPLYIHIVELNSAHPFEGPEELYNIEQNPHAYIKYDSLLWTPIQQSWAEGGYIRYITYNAVLQCFELLDYDLDTEICIRSTIELSGNSSGGSSGGGSSGSTENVVDLTSLGLVPMASSTGTLTSAQLQLIRTANKVILGSTGELETYLPLCNKTVVGTTDNFIVYLFAGYGMTDSSPKHITFVVNPDGSYAYTVTTI